MNKYLHILIFVLSFFKLMSNDTIPPSALEGKERISWLNDMARKHLDIDPELSRRYAREAQTLAHPLKYTEGLANAINYIGLSYYNQTHYTEAISYFQQALKLLANSGDNDRIANLLQKIGMCYLKDNNYRNTIFYYLQTLRIFEQLEYDDRLAQTYFDLGIVYYMSKDYSESIEALLKAVEKYQSLGNILYKSKAQYQLGLTYEAAGNYKKSLEYFQEVYSIYETFNNREQMAVALNNMGNVFISLKYTEQAIDVLKRALTLIGTKHKELRFQILLNTGIALNIQKNYQEAERTFLKGLNIASNLADKGLLKKVYENLYKLYSATNNSRKSMEYYRLYMLDNDEYFLQNQITDSKEESATNTGGLYRMLLSVSIAVNVILLGAIFILLRKQNRVKKQAQKSNSKN